MMGIFLLMRSSFKTYFKVSVLFLVVAIPLKTLAQKWEVPNKVYQMSWKSMVYLERIQKKPGLLSKLTDTVSGTGFLLSFKDNVYLITTMNNVQEQEYIGNFKVADSIYISASPDGKGGGIYLKLLHSNQKELFSSAQTNLQILLLNRSQQSTLKYLLAKGIKPISINQFYTESENLVVGDTLFNSAYTTYKDADGKRARLQGTAIHSVKSFDQKANSFVMDKAFKSGGNGSAVVFKDKVIGMMTHKLGGQSDGVVLKSSYIFSAIKSLQ
jgi:hypothetical protein